MLKRKELDPNYKEKTFSWDVLKMRPRTKEESFSETYKIDFLSTAGLNVSDPSKLFNIKE
jgi:hypothetical protein